MGLFRTAFIISLVIVPSLTPIGKETQPALQIVVLAAAGFTLAMFWLFLHGQTIPGQRPVTLLVDLLLVTVVIHTVGDVGIALFQVYYLIVLVGAIWFQLVGAILVAFGAITFYTIATHIFSPAIVSPSARAIMIDLGGRGAPFLLLIAVIAGYLVRTFNREMKAVAQIEQEMRLARTVQDSLLPSSLPAVPGYQVALRFEPARFVGGDLYNLERLPGGPYLLCLGDMPGKSAYGLVHLSQIHSHTHVAAGDPANNFSPAQIATTVNDAVYDTLQPDGYAALFIGILDVDSSTITFANCGHPPPMLLRKADETVVELSTAGMVIGAERDFAYTENKLQIQPGDLLVCYTDGVSEARNSAGDEFGPKGVEQTVWAIIHQQGSVEQMAEAIIRSAADFAAVPGTDDATVIVFRRES